jgi:hypothetical protein
MGIALVLLALSLGFAIQTVILLRQLDEIRAEYTPQVRPLAAVRR